MRVQIDREHEEHRIRTGWFSRASIPAKLLYLTVHFNEEERFLFKRSGIEHYVLFRAPIPPEITDPDTIEAIKAADHGLFFVRDQLCTESNPVQSGQNRKDRVMIKWCSYCQQFMKEIAPYDNLSITHGVCARCEATYKDLFAEDAVERARSLSTIFCSLFDAGRHRDFKAAAPVVEKAVAAKCRPVDILIGIIAPMLYAEDWKHGAPSAEAEHGFTAFYEQAVSLIESRLGTANLSSRPSPNATSLFLMNAPDNRHKLAVRLLALWLKSRGARVRIIEDGIETSSLIGSVLADQPSYLLISMGLIEQRDRVTEIARVVQSLPQFARPKIIVGGYPVKTGLIKSIPLAEFVSDISDLRIP